MFPKPTNNILAAFDAYQQDSLHDAEPDASNDGPLHVFSLQSTPEEEGPLIPHEDAYSRIPYEDAYSQAVDYGDDDGVSGE